MKVKQIRQFQNPVGKSENQKQNISRYEIIKTLLDKHQKRVDQEWTERSTLKEI